MSHKDNAEPPKPRTVNTTYAFATHLVGELDAPATDSLELGGSEVQGSPNQPLLRVIRGPNTGAEFLLDRPVTSAGREPACDILLDDVTVSRRHAEFRREDGEFVVFDLDSLNNTYVNQDPVYSSPLLDGDEIQIGVFRLLFLTGEAPD